MKDFNITKIKCGDSKFFFFFGKNKHKQCIDYNEPDKIIQPYSVNKILEKETKNEKIKELILCD